MHSRPSWRRSKTLTANRYRPPLPHPEYRPRDARGGSPCGPAGTAAADGIDKSRLTHPEPRRFRDKEHVKFVAKQACLICGRRPADAHHLRFAQHRALGRKVSDEFIVPLCRGHHREAHRCWRRSRMVEKCWCGPDQSCPRAVVRDPSACRQFRIQGSSIDRPPGQCRHRLENSKGLTRVATAPSARFRRLSKIKVAIE